MSNNVVSILGFPYVLPRYNERRGKTITFRANTAASTKHPFVEVTGHATEFGLVLHRTINPSGRVLTQKWTISEPSTGLRITHGATRQEAINALAAYVAYMGGEDRFQQALKLGVQQAMGIQAAK